MSIRPFAERLFFTQEMRILKAFIGVKGRPSLTVSRMVRTIV